MEEIQRPTEEYSLNSLLMKRNRTLIRENTRAVEKFCHFRYKKREILRHIYRQQRKAQKKPVNRERLKIEGRGEINDIAIANTETLRRGLM